MSRREQLDKILRAILESGNVYFQPPESVKMKYPCIRYELSDIANRHADNKNYNLVDRYTIQYINKDPDDATKRYILETFEMCSFDRFYTADNLNHYVFTLYY